MTSNKQKSENGKRDHYMPRTYLKHFENVDNSTNTQGVWVYYKTNSTKSTFKSTRSICFQINGDSNTFFKNHRILDDFLPSIENEYNTSLEVFKNHLSNNDAKLCIASLIARIRLLSPKKKELYQHIFKKMVFRKVAEDLRTNIETQKKAREWLETTSTNSDKISFQNLIEDLENPNIPLDFDQNWPNSILIKNLVNVALYYYILPWTIIHNETDLPFITSDNPVCVKEMTDPDSKRAWENIYFPLTPKLAVLIHLIPKSIWSVSHRLISSEEVVKDLNSTISKFSDKYVISNRDDDRIKNVVEESKNSQEVYAEKTLCKGLDEKGHYDIKLIEMKIAEKLP